MGKEKAEGDIRILRRISFFFFGFKDVIDFSSYIGFARRAWQSRKWLLDGRVVNSASFVDIRIRLVSTFS
jgi:hypothetical protein